MSDVGDEPGDVPDAATSTCLKMLLETSEFLVTCLYELDVLRGGRPAIGASISDSLVALPCACIAVDSKSIVEDRFWMRRGWIRPFCDSLNKSLRVGVGSIAETQASLERRREKKEANRIVVHQQAALVDLMARG